MNSDNSSVELNYRDFEDKFRGSRELILGRLSIYLPLISKIADTHSNSRRAVDLGSGRGEWLQLIDENGWTGIGVDPDAGMAISAAESGISTIAEDALGFLRKQKDHSFGLVTAFHLVEHVETNYLLDLIKEIDRVLVPDGKLILETPNPENFTVSTWSFYMDPTHVRPIPPLLLQYFVQSNGLVNAHILRLNGDKLPSSTGPVKGILSVLFNGGPDYAIVAGKNSSNNEIAVLEHFIRTASQLTSVAWQELASRADQIDDLQGKFEIQIESLNDELKKCIENAVNIRNAANRKIDDAVHELVEQIRILEADIQSVKNSKIWKIYTFLHRIGKFPK